MLIFLLALLVHQVQCLVFSIGSDTNVQPLLDSAAYGDVLQFQPMLYQGSRFCNLTLTSSGISLVGAANAMTIIDCAGVATRCLTVISARNVHIRGIMFKNGMVSTNSVRGMPNRPFRTRMLPRRPFRKVLAAVVKLYILPNGKMEKRMEFSLAAHTSIRRKKPTMAVRESPGESGDVSAGGCILIKDFSTVTLDNVVITGGVALLGGGIAAFNGSSITMTNSRIVNNMAVASTPFGTIVGGGGGYFENSNVVLSNQTEFSGNFVDVTFVGKQVRGGGLYLQSCSSVYIENCSFQRNVIRSTVQSLAIWGGGVSMLMCTNVIVGNGNIANANRIESWTSCATIAGAGFYFSLCGSGLQFGATCVSNSISVAGNDSTSQSDLADGGGAYFTNMDSIHLTGNLNFSLNSISGISNLHGAGLSLLYCSNVTVSGPSIHIAENALFSLSSSRYLQGSGVYLYSVQNATFCSAISIFDRNIITGGLWAAGGGVYIDSSADTFIQGPVSASNNVLTGFFDGSYCSGGGFYLYYSTNFWIFGPTYISNNSFVSTNNMYGAGVYAETMKGMHFIGSTWICNNSMVSSINNGVLFGAGMYIYDTDFAYILGPALFEANTASALLVPTGYNKDNSSSSNSNNSSNDSGGFHFEGNSCPPDQSLVQTNSQSGSIAVTAYQPSQSCSWLVSPKPTTQAYNVFEVVFEHLDLEKNYDFVSMYDGATSASPLIGKFSGTMDNVQCVAGTCPSVSRPIVSSAGQMLVSFTCDDSTQLTGFNLSWSAVFANRSLSTGQMGVLLYPNNYPGYAGGGGIALVSTDLHITQTRFRNNHIVHPFFGAGAALYAESMDCIVDMHDSVLDSNSAFSSASGGALAALVNAQVSCRNCTFRSNRAVGVGVACFYSMYVQDLLCPTALGAALLSATGSFVNLTKSVFVDNTGYCNAAVPCTARGGAIAVMHKESSVVMSNIDCILSRVSCRLGGYCPWMAGGSMYIDSAKVRLNNAKISNCFVEGVGSGGAIFTTGSAHFTISNVSVVNNAARQGGAIGATASSQLSVDHSVFEGNAALTVAGAIAMRDDASISLESCQFLNNTAIRASMIFAYNDNNVARYTGENNFVNLSPGSAVLMLGRYDLSSGNVFNCTWPGTVFTEDASGEFYSLTCAVCSAGTYAVDKASTLFANRTCEPCPFGGSCVGGGESSNGLLALGGFWGSWDTSGIASFYPCPTAYCCPITDTCESDRRCQGGRVGRLCGQCQDGQGLQFFSEGCHLNSDCNDSRWAFFAVVAIAFVFSVALVATTGHESKRSGMLSVLLYFYQVLPLVKSTPWKNTLSVYVTFLQSTFSMAPTSGESGGFGVCVLPSMTAAHRLVYRILLQFVIFLVLVSLYPVHLLVYRLGFRRIVYPDVKHYIATVIRFLTIAFTTLVLVPLQMLQCVWVEDIYVWWLDGSVSCYENWQIGAMVAAFLLLPVPLIVILLLKKQCNKEKVSLRLVIWSTMSVGYRQERKWWLGVVLYRKFILVLVYTMIVDLNWRVLTTIVVCTSSLVFCLMMKPYCDAATHYFEVVASLAHCVLAATVAPQLSQIQFGSNKKISRESGLEILQFVLVLIPLVMYGYSMLKEAINWMKWRHDLDKDLDDAWDRPDCALCREYGDCSLHQYC